MKAAIILGTRPEIIKMSPLMRELEKRSIGFFILHTGQHYSYNMDRVFFEQLALPEPKYNLEAGSGTHGEQTGRMMIGIEKVLMEEKPNIVLVEGDTNTVLAGALAASKLLVKIGHVEAGLRSYDRNMPEEVNRVLTDHVSDYLFAPTEKARENLVKEGIAKEKVFVTGNTIVDAVYQNIKLAEKEGSVTEKIGVNDGDYFLATIHRQENVDNKQRFRNILKGLEILHEHFSLPVVYPVHPRARKRMQEYGLSSDSLTMIEPLDYLSFLQLENKAGLILTDSGGVQEEACILRVPCVTLRYNTERPETIDVGANVIAGTEPEKILEKTRLMMGRNRDWENPFGDGKAAERIVNVINSENL